MFMGPIGCSRWPPLTVSLECFLLKLEGKKCIVVVSSVTKVFLSVRFSLVL